MKTLIHVTAALAAALSLSACGAPEGVPTEAAQPVENGELVASPGEVDLGRVAVGGEVRAEVTITNRGGYTVDVTRVLPPGPCRAVLFVPCLRPGASSALSLSCVPTEEGAFGGDLTLTYRNGGRDDQTLRIPVRGAAYRAR